MRSSLTGMDRTGIGSHRAQRLLRLRHVLEIFPVSRSRWYAGIKAGEYPKPIRISPNIVCWREEDILALIENVAAGQRNHRKTAATG